LTRFRLRLVFVNGNEAVVDFKPLSDESPGLASLRSASAFAKATLIEGEGWSVVWPALDIQIGADTLWPDAQAQNAVDENSRVFVQWRARNRLSLSAVAKALGLTPRTISAYGTGARPVPPVVTIDVRSSDFTF